MKAGEQSMVGCERKRIEKRQNELERTEGKGRKRTREDIGVKEVETEIVGKEGRNLLTTEYFLG